MNARQKAINVGVRVFSHYGYRQSNMELIAAEVGVTRQALYRHFQSKEALLLAVAETLHAGALEVAEQAGRKALKDGAGLAGTAMAALEARFGHILSRLAVSPHASELLEEHDRLCGAITAEYGQRFVERLAAIIEELLEARCAKLRAGLSASDLARYLFAAARSLKSTSPPPPFDLFRPDLERLVALIADGALSDAHETEQSSGAKNTSHA